MPDIRRYLVVAIAALTGIACANPQTDKTTTAHPGDHETAEAVNSADEHAEPRPFDADRNAMADVETALLQSRATGRNALLVLGANWCHDSRGIAAKFQQPPLQQIIADNYHLVWVDVGKRDRNIDVAQRFGVDELIGTPTILIVSPEQQLLNRESVHDWRTAHSKSMDEAISYFRGYSQTKAPQGQN